MNTNNYIGKYNNYHQEPLNSFNINTKEKKQMKKSKQNKKYKAPPNDNIMIKTTINTILIKVIQNI